MQFRTLVFFAFIGGFLTTSEGAPSQPAEKPRTERSILPTCSLCNLVVRGIFQSFDIGLTNDDIVDNVGITCVGLNLYEEEVCRGVAAAALPTVRYIYNSSKVDPGNVCGILMQDANCTFSDRAKLEWTITPTIVPKPALVNTQNILPPNSNTIKVIHFSDPHWDPEYLEGSNTNCKSPLCCRASSGALAAPEDAAGYWGDYRKCDMPWRTIESSVEHMAKYHSDAAYIVWTGDLVPHDIWDTSREENMIIHESLLNLVRHHFPNTPIYPTLGNHEAHPVNTFAPPEISEDELSTNWLYKDTDRLWTKFGLPNEVSSTVRYGGYYTTLARPGLRIVSLNTNYCYTFNWWTLYGTKDPASGLQWLVKTLQEAEQANEKVHIIAHIPPGNEDCWYVYSREFSKIISRFESTVTAQFYGHTHHEEFKLFYDVEDKNRPVNVAYIAGSLTSYSNLNPSYRVYTIDGSRPDATWAVLDFSTWILNLTHANSMGSNHSLEWFQLYQAKEEYGLTDLSPKSVENLVSRMTDDETLSSLYFKNYHKAADVAISKGCDDKCRKNLLCRLVTSNIAERSRCHPTTNGMQFELEATTTPESSTEFPLLSREEPPPMMRYKRQIISRYMKA